MKLTTFLRAKDKFPHISNIASKMVHNKVTRVLHVFRSNFWLAHRTMLKLGREVKDRRMGKIKLKKVVFVTFFFVFSSIFGFQPIRTHHFIEIKNSACLVLTHVLLPVPVVYDTWTARGRAGGGRSCNKRRRRWSWCWREIGEREHYRHWVSVWGQ